MKYTKSSLLIALVLLGICMGFTVHRYTPYFSKLTPNEVIKELKAQFTSYSEKNPEDRVYLQLDKPFYKPGETIWFQAYLQNGSTLKASESEILHVEFISPKGTTAKELHLIAHNGLASGDIELDPEMAGGLYKVKAYTAWQKHDASPLFFEKEIQVQKVILPRLKMKLDFEKEGYNPNDEVVAELHLESLSNEPLKNHAYTFTAKASGKVLAQGKGETNSEGEANISFELPAKLASGAKGLLNILIQYNGQTESISRSIPINNDVVTAEFFPEGGDLIAGLESRIAFRAYNELGKPIDINGEIIDEDGQTVAEFASFHQGMGAFTFTPKAGQIYTAELYTGEVFDLPEALPHGYALNVQNTHHKSEFKARVSSTVTEELSLFAQVRGKACYAHSFLVKEGKHTDIKIDVSDFPMGVAQFTLFDSKGIARAERLVFVNAHKQLNLEISTDKEQYQPREKVTMTIKATDERGIPLPGNLSLAVTDDKVISFADDKQGHILSKLLLEPDLKSPVYEPNFYFDKKEPDAPKALDYLLMTQGWRRFTWETVKKEHSTVQQLLRERTIIQGVVYKESKPVSGAKVWTADSTHTVMTDKDGKFFIKGVDLYAPVQIYAKSGKNQMSTYASDYSEVLQIELTPFLYEVEKDMAFGAADGDFGEMEEVFLEAVELNAEIETPDFEGAPKDLPEPIPVPIIIEVADEEKIEEPLEDGFFGIADDEDVWAADENKKKEFAIEAPDGTKYYRAREFSAPIYNSGIKPDVRTDFRPTIFWQGNVALDRTGKATVAFYTSDAITAFRATAEGICSGTVGRTEKTFYTQLPFSMDVKAPLEVTMGDQVKIPVTLTNNTSTQLSGTLTFDTPSGWQLDSRNELRVDIPAKKTITQLASFTILNQPEIGEIRFSFKGKDGSKDSFVQEVKIGRKGFPMSIALSGEEMDKAHSFGIINSIEGTIEAKVVAYPSTLSDMLAGIESILREPYGCFEQTSSSTYPNIMVLQYLQENDYQNQEVYQKANTLIDKGYKRLVTFETSEKGYEWFGGAPGHEALTAYGLMEFTDMKKVYGKVNEEMMQRTANWLLSKRDGKGGFRRNPDALDHFGSADPKITNAYIVYALSEAGYTKEIEKELNSAYKIALADQDPYQMAMVANALYNTKDTRADEFLANLNKLQEKTGEFVGKLHSITRSTGSALKVETTSLAILANLKAKERAGAILKPATQFLIKNRSSYGGYGNTQSTVLALKALTEFAKYAKRTAESGDLEVLVDGKKAGSAHFEKGQQGEIAITGLEKFLKDGKHKVSIRFKNCSKPLPYTIAVNYHTHLPPSSKKCTIGLSTTLASNAIAVGETVQLTTKLENLSKEGQPMTIAVIGLPGGLSAQPWQLKELQEQKAFDFYEISDSRVVFYYRQMKPNETREITLDLKGEIAGTYEGAASSAYLYYTSEYKSWVAGKKIAIKK